MVHLTPELRGLLAAQVEVERVRELEKKLGRVVPYLFPHCGAYRDGQYRMKGPHVGTRRKDFRKAWGTACRRVGCIGMLRHDFRRTAVRNLVDAGVSERVAMTVTGHKTRAVFDRYHIVSPGDLQEAARKLANRNLGKVLGKVASVVPLNGARPVSEVGAKSVENVVGGAGLEPATSAL